MQVDRRFKIRMRFTDATFLFDCRVYAWLERNEAPSMMIKADFIGNILSHPLNNIARLMQSELRLEKLFRLTDVARMILECPLKDALYCPHSLPILRQPELSAIQP